MGFLCRWCQKARSRRGLWAGRVFELSFQAQTDRHVSRSVLHSSYGTCRDTAWPALWYINHKGPSVGVRNVGQGLSSFRLAGEAPTWGLIGKLVPAVDTLGEVCWIPVVPQFLATYLFPISLLCPSLALGATGFNLNLLGDIGKPGFLLPGHSRALLNVLLTERSGGAWFSGYFKNGVIEMSSLWPKALC